MGDFREYYLYLREYTQSCSGWKWDENITFMLNVKLKNNRGEKEGFKGFSVVWYNEMIESSSTYLTGATQFVSRLTDELI